MAQPTFPALSPNPGALLELELLLTSPATCASFHPHCPCPSFISLCGNLTKFYVWINVTLWSLPWSLTFVLSFSQYIIILCCLNKQILKSQRPKYFSLMSQSDVSQAALLGSSSPAVIQGSQLLPSINSAISELSVFSGEEKGSTREWIPTSNCHKLEATHRFHSHSHWWELNHTVPNDPQRRLGNVGKCMVTGQHSSAVGSSSKGDCPVWDCLGFSIKSCIPGKGWEGLHPSAKQLWAKGEGWSPCFQPLACTSGQLCCTCLFPFHPDLDYRLPESRTGLHGSLSST